jgi:glycine betaine/proline transport system ATP-binding protein
MDEAFSALDPLIRSQMQDELLLLQEKMQKTILFITHDLEEAFKLGDRIAIMNDGEIVQVGTAEKIITQPANDYVKSFVEKVDHSTIITASSIMFRNPKIVRMKRDGPQTVLRMMRETGLKTLPVVRTNRTFLGYVNISDVVEVIKKKTTTIEGIINESVMVVTPDTTVDDMLPLITKTNHPIPVINDDNHLMGLVSLTSLIAESTGKDRGEIDDIIQKAIEL